jgi:hypothetical protein
MHSSYSFSESSFNWSLRGHPIKKVVSTVGSKFIGSLLVFTALVEWPCFAKRQHIKLLLPGSVLNWHHDVVALLGLHHLPSIVATPSLSFVLIPVMICVEVFGFSYSVQKSICVVLI